MTSAQLKEHFSPSVVDLGVVNPGDEVPFQIKNTSDMDIFGYTKSCGCVGTIKASDKTIEGQITASYKDTKQTIYKVDGQFAQKMPQGQVTRYYLIGSQTWVDTPQVVEGPFAAHLFSQSIVVKMKQEDVPDFIVSTDGEILENPERLKVTIPIKMWVLEQAQSSE